jgi:hypothetical protein
VAGLSRAGLATCKVHGEEFQSDSCYVISSPLPRLGLAQQDLTFLPDDLLARPQLTELLSSWTSGAAVS